MSIKTDNLLKRIQEIQQFAFSRSDRSRIFSDVYSRMNEIAEPLQEGKLVAHIVSSNNPVLALALENLCIKHKTLPDLYKFQTKSLLPEFLIKSCDIVCLVLPHTQQLTADVRQFLQKVAQTTMIQLVVVIELPNTDEQSLRKARTTISEIDSWFRTQNSISSYDIRNLFLQPFSPNAELIKVEASIQKELDQFCAYLEVTAKGKVEDYLIKQAISEALPQLDKIARVLVAEEESINKQIEEEDKKVQVTGKFELKKQIDKTFKKMEKDRTDFFELAKGRVESLKQILLDKNDVRGIRNNIEEFIQTLEVHTVDRSKEVGMIEVQIKMSDGNVIHNELIGIFRSYLNEKAVDEWAKILESYGDDGLYGLLSSTYKNINFIPYLNIPNPFTKPRRDADISKSFDASTKKKYEWVNSFKFPAFKTFCLEQFQRFISTVIGPIGALTGYAVPIMILWVADTNDASNVKAVFKQGRTVTVAGIALSLTILALLIIFPKLYKREREKKIQEMSEKVKQDGFKHYQDIALDYVNKMKDFLQKKLEREEELIKDVLEEIKDQITLHVQDVENRKKEYLDQLKKLTDEKKILESFKKM